MTAQGTLAPGWSEARLDEVTCNIRGRVQPRERPDLPFIGMHSVSAHTMKVLGTVPSSTMKSAAVRFDRGDVLYGRLRPYLNKVVTADFDGLASAEFIALTASRGIVPHFIQYRLNAADFVSFASHLDEGDRPRVDFGQIGAFRLQLAPTSEQHRIVEAVDSYFTRLDDAAATLERVQRNLNRYRWSVLTAAVEGRLVPTEAELARGEGREYEPASVLLRRILAERRSRWEASGRKGRYAEPRAPDTSGLGELPEGWCWATVDQLAYEVGYGSSAKTDRDLGGGVPVLRMGNVVEGRIDFSDLKYLPDGHHEFPELLLRPGDILFNRTNSAELVGKTAVFSHYDGPCSFASYLIRVRVCHGVRPAFVSHYVNSAAGRSWIASVVSQQVGQANVNGTKLKACAVPLPPMTEQDRILQEIDRLFSIAFASGATANVNHERCGRLRQAILKWAFEGRLADQDPGDEPASVLLERIEAERAVVTPAKTRRPSGRVRKTA